MNRIFRTLNSVSDNRKSKIQNRKWMGIFAIVLTFVFGGVEAAAQQPKKVARIGYLSGPMQLVTPPVPKEFGWLCANVAT